MLQAQAAVLWPCDKQSSGKQLRQQRAPQPLPAIAGSPGGQMQGIWGNCQGFLSPLSTSPLPEIDLEIVLISKLLILSYFHCFTVLSSKREYFLKQGAKLVFTFLGFFLVWSQYCSAQNQESILHTRTDKHRHRTVCWF